MDSTFITLVSLVWSLELPPQLFISLEHSVLNMDTVDFHTSFISSFILNNAVSDGLSEWRELMTDVVRTEGGILGFVGELIKWTLGLLGTIFFVITLFAGFQYMTAGGDSQKVSSAVGLLKNAAIGLVIIAGSYLITEYVISAVLGGVSS